MEIYSHFPTSMKLIALLLIQNMFIIIYFIASLNFSVCAPVCAVDLVFVVDSSYLFGSTNWRYLLNFTASIAQRLVISPTATQVGFVSYGYFGTDQFYLNTYTSTSQVVNAILSLAYNGDWSNEYNGITQAYSSSFAVTNGNRSNASNVAVVVSGTPYNQGPSPVAAAVIAQSQKVKILSVGVASASPSDVYNISSPPRTQNVTYWNVPTFEQLFFYVGQLYDQICPSTVNTTLSPGKLKIMQ